MAGVAHELYLYWRTPLARWAEAAAALGRWQTSFCAGTTGLQARWLRRVDDDAIAVTLMEIWLHPAGVDAATARRIADEGNAVLAPWLTGTRHVETFAAG